MPKIHWDPLFEVRIQKLDAQHHRLVDFMNEVYDRLDRDLPVGDYRDFFTNLKRYAFEHFKTEEEYFKQFKYRDAAAHIKDHDKIRARIGRLEKEFTRNPSPTVVFEMLQFLDDWLFDHTVMFDKKYTEHFRACGLK